MAMKSQTDHGVRPLWQALRDAERKMSDAEWSGDAEAIARANAALAPLKSQAERGEQYAVPF